MIHCGLLVPSSANKAAQSSFDESELETNEPGPNGAVWDSAEIHFAGLAGEMIYAFSTRKMLLTP